MSVPSADNRTMVLERFNIDPALASGPILTTVTDVVGFFAFLGLASWILL